MSKKSLERRVLDLEVDASGKSLRLSLFFVAVAVFFIIIGVISSHWLSVGVWTVLGGLHTYFGTRKYKDHKELRAQQEQMK